MPWSRPCTPGSRSAAPVSFVTPIAGRSTSASATLSGLAEAGIEPSVGSKGDSYDKALAETIGNLERFTDPVPLSGMIAARFAPPTVRTYLLNLFSPETYASFSSSDRTVTGFRKGHWNRTGKVRQGDLLVCYVTQVSRWVGLLEAMGTRELDESITHGPFPVRLHVRPLVWLPLEFGLPIRDDAIWEKLSFTRGTSKAQSTWTGAIRASLVELRNDGSFLAAMLQDQELRRKTYPLEQKGR